MRPSLFKKRKRKSKKRIITIILSPISIHFINTHYLFPCALNAILADH